MTAFSQKTTVPPPHCGSDVLMKELIKINPKIEGRIKMIDDDIRNHNKENQNARLAGNETITIPIGIIIVHNSFDAIGTGTNISDNQVNDQIAALNDYFSPYGINFCLATRYSGGSNSPIGNSSTAGIARRIDDVLTNHNALTDQQTLANMGSSADPSKYLRIWVVRSINGLGNNVLGYSMFPNSSTVFDGVVMRFDVFGNGSSNLLPNYNQGKTLVHEIGHYLGLYHTFEGGCAGSNPSTCNTSGDRVCDTPPVASPNYGCVTGTDSCPDSGNLPDEIHNFMDYGNDSCVDSFTEGQRERIFSLLAMYRSTLYSTDNLIATQVCGFETMLSSNFTPTTSTGTTYSVCNTTNVTFTPITTVNTTYLWDFGDGSPTSTAQNPTKTFSATNSPYTVTLTVTRGSEVATSSKQIFVTNCSAIASGDGNWYVSSNNLLNFSTGVPVSTSTPNLAQEASTCQSNSSGNLLFYSNGSRIFNSANTALGSANLSGHPSAMHGAISVPNPANSNQYYVFTRSSMGGTGGLRFSLVNISGTTATLSSTVDQAVTIPAGYTTSNGGIAGGEGIAVAQHCSGYWIVTTGIRNSLDYIITYNLTSSGLSFVSEIQIQSATAGSPFAYITGLRFSPDENKLLFFRLGEYAVHLYDFNKFNGTVLGSPTTLSIGNSSTHGVSFSPNSKLLYINNGRILQFNTEASNIQNSVKTVGIVNENYDLQIGPDNKIYGLIANSNMLFIIHNPNNMVSSGNPNACNFTSNGIILNSQTGRGLPNIINAKATTAFPTTASISNYPNSCFSYRFVPNACGTSFNWNFGDAASGANNTSSLTNPTHTFSTNGTYTITLRNSSNAVIATTTVIIGTTATAISGSTSICPNGNGVRSTNNSIVLGAGQTVVWSITSGTGTITSLNNQSSVDVNWTTTGTLAATITNASGCTATSSINITQQTIPTPVISGSGDACKYNPTTTNSTVLQPGQSAFWSISSGGGVIMGYYSEPTVYARWTALPATLSLQVTNSSGCTSTATKTIQSNCINPVGTFGYVHSVSLQSDGKIVIGGEFTEYKGIIRNRIARLNSDMSLDTSFNVGSGANNIVRKTLITSDGNTIIGGDFSTYNGVSKMGIVKLNSSDASINSTFNVGTGLNSGGYINVLEQQTDGKVLIGGYFSSYKGTSKVSIARLLSDGSIDTSFNTTFIASIDEVTAIAIQSDGKILVAGFFSTFGSSTKYLVRLNSNGTVDTTYNTGTGFDDPVQCLKLQSDGKLLVSGRFHVFNGNWVGPLIRLNDTGSIDSTFVPGVIMFGDDVFTGINTIAIQSDNKIIFGGTIFDSGNRIARIMPNGSFDSTFNTGSGFGPAIGRLSLGSSLKSVAIQPDGKIVCGGAFNSYNEISANNITRINPSNPTEIGRFVAPKNKMAITLFPNPVSSLLNLDASFIADTPFEVIIKTIDGKELLRKKWELKKGKHDLQLELPNTISDGMVFVELISDEMKETRTIIIKK